MAVVNSGQNIRFSCRKRKYEFEVKEYNDEVWVGDEEYESLGVVNRGTYGVVYKGRHKKSGETVAMKHQLQGFSPCTLREIGILIQLPPHPSIVQFKELHQEHEHGGRAFLVMEYMESDLHRFLEKRRSPLTIPEIKSIMKKILEGICFLHSCGVMHRDLKPANILTNNNGDQVKICDFGMSRSVESDSGLYTPNLVTLWYRSPELLVHGRRYTPAIDIWSVGCIMGEMVLDEVVFKGDSEVSQFLAIQRVNSGGIYKVLRQRLSKAETRPGAPILSASGLHLLTRLLAFSVDKRISAKEALNHEWFKDKYYRRV